MYIYGTTLVSADHNKARGEAVAYASAAKAASDLNWAAYDHVFATYPEIITISAPVDSRAQLLQAMAAIADSSEASAAYASLRDAAPVRQDALWYMVNPPEGEVAGPPGVISMWISHLTGPFEKALAWALDMVNFVEGELGQRYLVGTDRVGPPGRLAFAQYADSLEEDEARDRALFGHPETFQRLSQPVEQGLLSSEGDRIIMARLDD